MIKREDGPIKHYRMVCDLCKKQTKRFAYEFHFNTQAPQGWEQIDENEDECYTHHCPKCSSKEVQKANKEVIPNIGDSLDISDHAQVRRPLIRKTANELVIDLQDGNKLVITSETPIKIEHHEV